jgi:hypothetical protein
MGCHLTTTIEPGCGSDRSLKTHHALLPQCDVSFLQSLSFRYYKFLAGIHSYANADFNSFPSLFLVLVKVTGALEFSASQPSATSLQVPAILSIGFFLYSVNSLIAVLFNFVSFTSLGDKNTVSVLHLLPLKSYIKKISST